MVLPTVRIFKQSDQLVALKLSAFSATVVQLIKGIPSARWDPKAGAWLVDISHTQDALVALAKVPHKLEEGVAESVHRNLEAVGLTAAPSARPSLRCKSISKLMTCAWIETSSAETGSSQIINFGLTTKARAMPTR